MKYTELCRKLHKQSAAMLTPQAQQAAIQPPAPPMDPSMMGAGGGMPPGGAPMGPAMMGGAPMDPAMAGGMPPGGAPPMDPSMMGAGGGMPPQGVPPMPPQGGGMWMQDQLFLEFLMQMGLQADPNTGTVMTPDGQQLPPQIVQQMYAQFQAQVMAAQQGGMDPAMMGGAPAEGAPVDPAMPEGAPMQGMPPQGQMPPQAQDPAAMQEEFLNQAAGILHDIVDTVMQQKLSVFESKITAFNQKLDTIKTLLDDILTDSAKADKQKAEQQAVNDQIQRDLKNSQEVQPVQIVPTEALLAQQQPAQVPVNMLDVMRGA